MLFTSLQLLNEMFIFNDKYCGCSNSSAEVHPLYTAVSEEYLRNRQTIFIRIKSAFSPLLWLKFSFKFVNFSELCQKT